MPAIVDHARGNCCLSTMMEQCTPLCAHEHKMAHEVLTVQVELPLGVTEDRICGTIDIERALQEGIKAFEPGLLVSISAKCFRMHRVMGPAHPQPVLTLLHKPSHCEIWKYYQSTS